MMGRGKDVYTKAIKGALKEQIVIIKLSAWIPGDRQDALQK
jgi:hypothetical protein